MIVTTVGHVDHGKSTLVRALTGVDTDRLPEEKARGMSIDLGFAYHRMADGQLITFVDVPGHERFMRNMLAGMAGINLALIVVAADDGVMPQTMEHMDVLELLGCSSGAVVITKCDQVMASRTEQVSSEVRSLLAGKLLDGIPIFHTAAPQGHGIAGLMRHLEAQAAAWVAPDPSGPCCRMAIDRAFQVIGSGTVVTGTIFDGQVQVGDQLRVSPTGGVARVRGIHIHDGSVTVATRGQRCALNLSGIAVDSVLRGHWLASDGWHQPTTTLDVSLRLLPDRAVKLSGTQTTRLHLGTAEVEARLQIIRNPSSETGHECFAQLRLREPIGALRGDRFILRDVSRRQLVGGGVVLDSFVGTRRTTPTARLARLRALEAGSASTIVQSLLRINDEIVDLNWLGQTFKLPTVRVKAIVEDLRLIRLGAPERMVLTGERVAEIGAAVMAWLSANKPNGSQTSKASVTTIRHAIAPRLTDDVLQTVVERLIEQGLVKYHKGNLCLDEPDPATQRADQKLWERVEPKLLKGDFHPVTFTELSHRMEMERAVFFEFCHRMVGLGRLLRVGDDRFYPRQTLIRLAQLAAEVASAQTDGLFTAAQFRDAIGTGRTLAIEILECLDRQRVTLRAGNLRRMVPNAPTLAITTEIAMSARPKSWRSRHRFTQRNAAS